MKESVRRLLFKGFTGCGKADCVIVKPDGVSIAEGSCMCLHSLSRCQLNLIKKRLAPIADKFVEGDDS